MIQELGNNEDENQEGLSSESAELSEQQETAPASRVNETADDAEDTPAEDSADATEEPVAEAASDDGDGDEVEVTEPESAAAADDEGDEDEPVPDEADEGNGLRRGDLIKGTVARTTPNEIFIDLGNELEGVVPKREVELMSAKVLQQLQEGAEIHVLVVNPRNHRGEIMLSVNHAQEEMDWRRAEDFMQDKRVYDGKIGGYNKGGLIVRFGRLRGFVPQSQISDKRMLDVEGETPEERYGSLVNKQISVKVMEVDRSRNRLILSERAAMREVRQRRKEALITELEVGEVRDGRVVSLENFGAFVDIGGAEGLVHLTELSWKHITHPRQVLDVGQEVKVRVISVDPQKNRIGLSIKQLLPDPWDQLASEFGTGALIKATVTKLTKFGAFARVDRLDSIEGLIHISELSDDRVEHPREVVQKGDKLTLRVVKIDVAGRRLGLSLRRVNSAEFLDDDLKRAYREQEQRVEDEDDEIVPPVEDELVNDPILDADEDDPDSDFEVLVDEDDDSDAGDDDSDAGDDDSDAGDDDSDAGDDDSDAGDDDSDAGDDDSDAGDDD